jgi:hypothetical protein
MVFPQDFIGNAKFIWITPIEAMLGDFLGRTLHDDQG